MKGIGFKTLSMMVCAVFFLVAFNNVEGSKEIMENEKEVMKDDDGFSFPTKTSKRAKAIEGGHLNYGLVSDSPFEGLLNWAFFQSGYDAAILQVFDEPLLSTDENYVFNQDGAATYELSEDRKTITLTIRDGVNWHDGNPVTGEDLEFAYLTIGHPEYKGARYDALFQMIEGMEEYHAGKTKRISGIKTDGKKISITFKEANPSILTGLWTYPLHKKYLGNLSLSEMESSDKIRKYPIGFGPYKVKRVVQGEAVEFEAYHNYWKGNPQLDSITLSVVNSTTVVKALESGKLISQNLVLIYMRGQKYYLISSY